MLGYGRYSSRSAFFLVQRLYGLLCFQLNPYAPTRSSSAQSASVAKSSNTTTRRARPQRVLTPGILTPA